MDKVLAQPGVFFWLRGALEQSLCADCHDGRTSVQPHCRLTKVKTLRGNMEDKSLKPEND